jgi:hypothetical protein
MNEASLAIFVSYQIKELRRVNIRYEHSILILHYRVAHLRIVGHLRNRGFDPGLGLVERGVEWVLNGLLMV